jgi:hypothetical protein
MAAVNNKAIVWFEPEAAVSARVLRNAAEDSADVVG